MQTPSAQNLPVSVEKPAGMDYNRFVYILLPRAVAARQQFFPFIIAQNVSFGQGLQAILTKINFPNDGFPRKGQILPAPGRNVTVGD